MANIFLINASRGLGFAFLTKLSETPANVVIGLVRNKAMAEKRVAEELGDRSNIHVVEADLTDYDAVKKSADQVATITGGKLDYLVANAGLASNWSSYFPPSVLAQKPMELQEIMIEYFHVNVVGNINLYNAYIPLVLNGTSKKVITLSTGHADFDLVTNYKIATAVPYAVSKPALNTVVAKFLAEYSEQGVLFMSICPGFVGTGQQDNIPEEGLPYVEELIASLLSYAPNMKKSTSEEAINAVLSVAEKATLGKCDGGSVLSHKGNKQWL